MVDSKSDKTYGLPFGIDLDGVPDVDCDFLAAPDFFLLAIIQDVDKEFNENFYNKKIKPQALVVVNDEEERGGRGGSSYTRKYIGPEY